MSSFSGALPGVCFVSGAALLLSLAPSVGEVASLGTAFGGRGLPRPRTFSLFRPRFPSPTVCPKTVAPVLGDFCEWGGDTPCARLRTFRHVCAARDGLVFGKRSSPRYSSFCGPAPSPAMCSQANVSLRRGPPRATKVQQLLIFGVPPPPGEAGQGGGGLLPMSVRQGGPARFSPDFRVLSQKMGQKGLARGCFPHFAGCFPTCYVNLANFTPVIGSTSS